MNTELTILKPLGACLTNILMMTSLLGYSGCPGQQRSSVMNPYQAQTSMILSADLVPFISEAGASMVLASVQDVNLAPRKEQDLEVEAGTVVFQALEIFHSDVLRKGMLIKVPARRIVDRQTRARNNFDQWNNLSLSQGELVILALGPIEPPELWKGLAAIRVDSPASPTVAAMRQCYVIEKFAGPPSQKLDLFRAALVSREDLLRFYALDAVGRRASVNRDVGAKLIAEAITSQKADPDHRLDLGAYLTRQYFFNKDLKDDRANQTVLAGIARGLVNETDAARRLEWAKFLASCILPEFSPDPAIDRVQRSALIKSVQNPSPNELISALSGLLSHGAADEREIVKKLIGAWRAAV